MSTTRHRQVLAEKPATNGKSFGAMPEHQSSGKSASSSVLDLLSPDDPMQQELRQLLADNRKLMTEISDDSGSGLVPDAANLLEENERLRERVAELEQELEQSAAGAELAQIWEEQQTEYEALLEEKSETIRQLNLQLHELRGGDGAGDAGANPLRARQELAELKAELEEQRKQLEEDEEALMEQARQMEMSMSKERVELARQKNKIQQMHTQFQREIEQANRDGDLRERLLHLSRQHQEQM